jgi:hypothetical protein
MFETVTFTAPAYWSSALINGDYSGCDDEECEAIKAACDNLIRRYGNAQPVDVSEPFFTSGNTDYGDLAGDYAEYTLLIERKSL